MQYLNFQRVISLANWLNLDVYTIFINAKLIIMYFFNLIYIDYFSVQPSLSVEKKRTFNC